MKPKTKEFLRDMLERAASTFIQTAVVLLFAVNTPLLDHPNWLVATVAGGVAAAMSVLTTLASAPFPPASNPWVDLMIRVIKTFLQAFVGSLVVFDYVHVNWYGAATTALPVALLALAKGLIAMNVPGTEPGPTLLTEPKSVPDETPATQPEPATDSVEATPDIQAA